METQATINEWAYSVGINAAPIRSVERAVEEIDEALAELRAGGTAKAGVEIADAIICLMVAASRLGVDIQAEIDAKMQINRARQWRVDETGCVYHVK